MTTFLRRIFFVYLRPYGRQCLLLFLCMLTLIAFDTLFPLGTTFLIDLAITPQDWQMFLLLVVGLTGLYLAASIGSLGLDYIAAWVIARVANDMRLKMFAHLHDLPAGYYNQVKQGDIITRFNTDMAAIENALAYSVVQGLQSVLTLLISVLVLIRLNVSLGILTVLILPLTVIVPRRLVGKASAFMDQRRTEEFAITSTVQDNLQAHAVNRMFGLRDLSIRSFQGQLERLAAISTRTSFTEWMVGRATNIGQYLIQLLVVAVGGYLVYIGKMSIGSWVGFTGLLISVGYSFSWVSVALAGLIPAVTSLQRVESLLNEGPAVDDHPEAVLAPFSSELRFNNVSFSYGGAGAPLNLDRLDFSIPSGQSVAFIGRSGSGKSTVLNLLMRFYDPHSGRIMLDGQDVNSISLASLRSQMGVVFQDTFLFNITLRENIRLGKPGASDEEVEAAARAAGIHEAILGLPAGYDTLAGEAGKGLSGGQRQRIAIARAMIRRPAILLLDEATSALDPETEMHIYETLKSLRNTSTILSVTHRLAPVVDMDRIIVLDQGRVVESGTHNDLLEQQGLYYQLFTQQNGFTVSPDGLYAEVTPARLRKIPLFSQLDEAALQLFSDQFVTERFPAGQAVVREGEQGDKFYIIVRGKTTVSVIGPDQQSLQVASMQDGDYFGEIALLENSRRTATVQTVVPSLFLSLDSRRFTHMVESYPGVHAAIDQASAGAVGWHQQDNQRELLKNINSPGASSVLLNLKNCQGSQEDGCQQGD